MAATVSKNSTIVRSSGTVLDGTPLAVRAARVGLRALAPVAPSVASHYAERLFLTARRHRRPAWEEQALAGAERFAIPHAGGHLPAWRWGEGASTVLLVHGWEGRGSQLAAFVAPLRARGLSVVTFDAPGHGDAERGFSSVVEHGRAVASVGAFLGPLHAAIGHSVGGAAILFATRLGFGARRLALIAPPTSPRKFAAGFSKYLRLSPSVQRGMLRRLERRYGVRIEDLDVRQDAARVTSPLLVVHDVGDRVVAFDEGAALATAAPAGQLVSTHGLGHHRVLRAPEVLDAVVPFVSDGARAPSFTETLEADLFMRDRRWI